MITRQTASGRGPVSFPDSAEFELPLTTSVTPLAGFGSVTYTRATQAYVNDNEGVIRRAISGEARFEGARRVQNIFTYSQELTNAAWTVAGITRSLHTEIINGIPTYSLLDDATTVVHRIYQAQTFVSGNTYIASYYLKQNRLAYAQIYLSGVSNDYANFDLSTGTVSDGTDDAGSISSLGNGWYRCSLKFTTTSGGSNAVNLITINSGTSARAQSYLGTGVGYYASAAQLEDVTGQSIQTVGDYVSTNVLSSPFHGAMVDGVKYFNTTLAGDTISASTLKGVLIEGARTNLLLQSENLITSWSAQGVTRTSNPIAVPTGSLSGIKIIPSAGTQVSQTYQSITTSATNYTFSVYAKAGEMSFIQLRANSAISNGYVNFDLVSGTLNAPSTWTGMIEALPNGWYRCMATTETVAVATNNVAITVVSSLTSTNAEAVTGDGVGGLYLWQAQWENGTFASSPISTAAASTTRNADTLSYNVSNVVSAKGAVYLEFTTGYVPLVGVDRRVLALSGNTNNRFQLVATSTTNNRTAILVGNGSSVIGTDLSIAMSTGSYSKMAGKWVNSSVANLFQNGSKSTNLASPVVAVTQIDVGTAGGNAIFGSIKNLKVWKSPPTDSELQALTTL